MAKMSSRLRASQEKLEISNKRKEEDALRKMLMQRRN